VPGIVASFIIPLFLSIGKSLLLTNLLQGVDLYENILILFGFCLLASVSARNFINALAEQALRTAKAAKRTAKAAETGVQENLELLSEQSTKSETKDSSAQKNPAQDQQNKVYLDSFDGTVEAKKVLEALVNGELSRRSITGIAKEIGLPKTAVRSALQTLVQLGKVAEAQSNRTGVMLYQAILGPSDQNR
jgi:phospholipase/lecithinase/hemolysin